MRNSLLGLVKDSQAVSNKWVRTKTQKIPILIYILKLNQSINYVILQKMATSDLSLQFQRKVQVVLKVVAHFFDQSPFSSHMSHICNTEKWALRRKVGHH